MHTAGTGTTGGSSEQLDELLTSVEFTRALENENFKRFLDYLPIAIAICKTIRDEQRIVYSNLAFEKVTGLATDQILGRTWSVLDAYRKDDSSKLSLGHAIASGEDFLGCFVLEGTTGKDSRIEASTAVIEREGESDDFRLVALVDISERDHQLRESFEKTLRDRDLLLKELQHRVKNNLQIITALVRLEARGVGDVEKSRFDTMAARIEALGLLYQALSGAPTVREVDLGSYLSQVASALLRSHGEAGIHLDLQVDHCPTSINVAMPVGLVVNEAMTNALKHAFEGRDGGTISLECVRADNHYTIRITDDGIGLPEGATWPQQGKISALIVQSLRENTGAQVEVESTPLTGTTIRFTVPRRSTAQDG